MNRSRLALLLILAGGAALMVMAIRGRSRLAPQDSPAIHPGGRLMGTVRRARSERPLGDVEVELQRARRAAGRTVTSRDGRFSFVALDPGEYEVVARTHPREKEARVGPVIVSADQDAVRDLIVETGPIVSGRVVAWDGRKIDRAAIKVLDVGRPGEAEVGGRLLDDQGGFEIMLGIPRGKCTITAVAAGYPESEPVAFAGSSDVEGIVLKLIAGGGVRGVVEDEQHRPVSRAVVSLQARVGENVSRTARRETSDGSGRFTFRDLAPGWSLWGRVLSSDGQPIPEAEIDISEGDRTYSTLSKSDGSFRLDGITPGKEDDVPEAVDSLKCRAKGFGTDYRTGLPPDKEVSGVLRSGGGILITAALSEGPAPKDFTWMARVTLVRPLGDDPSGPFSVMQGMKSGTGTVGELCPGSYDVEVSASGRQTVTKTGILVTAGAVTPVQVLLAPGRSEARGMSLRFKDASSLRSQLKTRMSDLDPEGRKDLLQFLRSAQNVMPADDPTRKAIEEVLKEYPE